MSAKLISNYLVTGMIGLVAEAFTAARAAQVDWRDLYEVMLNGSGNSGVLRKMMEAALAGDFDGYKFSIANAAKDIGYYADLAEELGRLTPLTEAVEQIFARCGRHGPWRPQCQPPARPGNRRCDLMLKLNPNITVIEEEGAFAVLDRALALKAKGAPDHQSRHRPARFLAAPPCPGGGREGGARRAAWLYLADRHSASARGGGGPCRGPLQGAGVGR